jgi:hypothetical protein
MGEGLARETIRDVSPAMIRGAKIFVVHAKGLTDRPSIGPSAPGEAPARHEGMIHDGIGRTQLTVTKWAAAIAWGFGVGPEALARIEAHAARRGETLGDMFAIGNMNEYGTVNYELARTHPMRPFIRPTEEEKQDEVVDGIERAMGLR